MICMIICVKTDDLSAAAGFTVIGMIITHTSVGSSIRVNMKKVWPQIQPIKTIICFIISYISFTMEYTTSDGYNLIDIYYNILATGYIKITPI